MEMRKFDNQVQFVKNEVIASVARLAFEGRLYENISEIPKLVNPGPDPRFRCCIHHERAITAERITMVMGGQKDEKGIVQVLESACDQCPVERYTVTETCRGCLAHRCKGACPVNAITIVDNKAVIDYSKCIECGKCKTSCPYNAIAGVMRPCRRDCPTGAIEMDSRKKAVIDHDKCISCGACVYKCPFGAIQEKSEVLPVIDKLRDGHKHMYAMLAPAFSSQFDFADLGQVIHGIKKLGFKDVVEVALGADMVVQHESAELLEAIEESTVLTSSCCPGFVNYIDIKYPKLKGHVSKTVSPMIATARLIKKIDNQAEVVFIGPCIAKKSEKEKTKDVEYVLTFEELAALIESRDIDLTQLSPHPLNNASYFGRKFAASGGLSMAVKDYLGEDKAKDVRTMVCDGIAECDKALKLTGVNRLQADFVEGMACKGGCIKGPVTMHHGPKDVRSVENYSKKALEENPDQSLRIFDLKGIDLE
jgi:[FeFe] hydrogenase (group B1/B3)